MITVLIPRVKPEGEGNYCSIILTLPWYNYSHSIIMVKEVKEEGYYYNM